MRKRARGRERSYTRFVNFHKAIRQFSSALFRGSPRAKQISVRGGRKQMTLPRSLLYMLQLNSAQDFIYILPNNNAVAILNPAINNPYCSYAFSVLIMLEPRLVIPKEIYTHTHTHIQGRRERKLGTRRIDKSGEYSI